jgi:hypothetical protein
MGHFENTVRKYFGVVLLVIAVTCGACKDTKQPQANAAPGTPAPGDSRELAVDDVSLLFPAPVAAADMSNVIAVSDLTAPNPQDSSKRDPVWPAAAFQQFVGIANSKFSQVAGTSAQIGLPAGAQNVSAWFIAGIRIDAGAPGLTNDIRAQFGRLPQIRLIVQPVTRAADGTPTVLDIAGHLIYNFTLPTQTNPPDPACFPLQSPDPDAFNSVLVDLTALRNKLRDGQLGGKKISTAGLRLGVHPGLADPATAAAFRGEIVSLLQKHISGDRLDGMAIAALPSGAPAPWIFLSMLRVPKGAVPSLPNGGFVPLHAPTLDGSDQQFAELLQPTGTIPRVVPEPHTNNLNPITCKNASVSAASIPATSRNGVATAELFAATPPTPERTKQILDIISDPTKSQFFNTDCVSCHTETRRAMDLQNVKDIPGIDPAVLPRGQWDIRNFGWSPTGGKNPAVATVTRRAANETAAVAAFINSELLPK